MPEKPYEVLFLCTGNSARSILAEAIGNRVAGDRLRVHSAGSRPRGQVHRLALAVLRERGYDTKGLRSKSWDEFAGPGAPRLDFVITVCDDAAGETCPVWPGQPVTAHWGMEDPAACEGPPERQRRLFCRTCVELERRIERLASLPLASLDRPSLRARLDDIGKPPPGRAPGRGEA